MKALDVTVKPDKPGQKVTLHLICCLHIGHLTHDRDATLELFQRIYRKKNAYAVSLGDTIDNGTKQSPGASIYEQTANPLEQTLIAADLWEPIVKARKLLWAHESNHSARTFKEGGFFTAEQMLFRYLVGNRQITKRQKRVFDMYLAGTGSSDAYRKRGQYVQRVFDNLRIDNKNPRVAWGGWQAIVKLKAGKQTYYIHSMHGEGSGTSMSAPINALVKQKDIAHAEIFMRGHHHKRAATEFSRAEYGSDGPVLKRIGLISTGCYLGYNKSYGEAKGYAPTCIGSSKLVLETGDKHAFEMVI